MNHDFLMVKVLKFLSDKKRPCNPFHATSFSECKKEDLRSALNYLEEKGYIKQTLYHNDGFSVLITEKGRNFIIA